MKNYTINPIIKHDDLDYDLNDRGAEIYYNRYLNTRLRLIKDGEEAKGMCFNYATKNYNLEYCEDCLEYIKAKYKEVDISQLQKGDIAIFYDDMPVGLHEHTVQHFAIVIKASNNISDIIIRSKWGDMGIFEGRLIDLPSDYGDRVIFYRKKVFKKT